ncbi:hypothetical protein SBDP2_310007 [Syntrophobacter sp. SbD2]|nr:hypothetical protein SBDP2_310007 [Syntrophobacter sp. SbD2]
MNFLTTCSPRNHMLAEERSHYILLADLRFYYIDTGHWFMEKAKTGLDGA